MAKLKVLQKENRLFHAHVSIHFKQHGCNRISRVDVSNYVLGYHIQSRCLLSKKKMLLLGHAIDNTRNKFKLFQAICSTSNIIKK